MKINYQTIPHNEQRYPTVGDYYLDREKVWQFRVSELSDVRMEMLIFIHELIEWSWVMWKGVKIKDIDQFDMEYERNRKEDDLSEPGDQPDAPYHKGHVIASAVERVVAIFLGVNWKSYESEVNEL